MAKPTTTTCYPCYADYEACCDREADEMLHCEEQATKAAAPAQGMPDALAPWYRAIARWAVEDSRQT